MKKSNKDLFAFTDHLTQQFGAPGAPLRNQFEQEFEAFRLEVLLHELRKEKRAKAHHQAD